MILLPVVNRRPFADATAMEVITLRLARFLPSTTLPRWTIVRERGKSPRSEGVSIMIDRVDSG
ncbi:hypothetical protein DPMN_163858 [Dreissena polymorpha]|uniref:Uncharacterized protein n=1 Tax=Dreissena polymorpha TaxID=45954 RepID=A0A9D4IUT9_DREPO|nr:hypothetical protein DPMN_163858 [Dreissena polymorpha]